MHGYMQLMTQAAQRFRVMRLYRGYHPVGGIGLKMASLSSVAYQSLP
jgi:hypothetical protein